MSNHALPSDSILRRIDALLAKAESTEFPDEAEAFLAKAQELIARHAIDDAMLRRAGTRGPSNVITKTVDVAAPYATARTRLLGAVARANHCRVVISGGTVDGGRRCFLVGHQADVDQVMALMASLSLHATQSMLAAPPEDRTRRFRHAFLVAYADRIAQRLREASAAAVVEAERVSGNRVQLALRDRRDAVDRAVAEQFPSLGRTRTTVSSGAGYAAGQSAANRAALGQRGLTTRPALTDGR